MQIRNRPRATSTEASGKTRRPSLHGSGGKRARTNQPKGGAFVFPPRETLRRIRLQPKHLQLMPSRRRRLKPQVKGGLSFLRQAISFRFVFRGAGKSSQLSLI